MVTGQELVDWCMELLGVDYRLGAENDGKAAEEIEKMDCSELMQNCTQQKGVEPPLPDGASNQWAYCREAGLEISLEDAYSTPGALLFRMSPSGNHVAMSRGVRELVTRRNLRTGVEVDIGEHWTTIEAKGKDWGVVVDAADRPGFNFAALIPGVDYGEAWS